MTLLLSVSAVAGAAPSGIHARLERYLDAECTQKVLFDHLFYWGECWNDDRGSIMWTDANDAGVNQCTWALKAGGDACRGTPSLCQRIPWGDCVPNFQRGETALPPHDPFRAPVSYVKWVRFDASAAKYYTMMGPYMSTEHCNSYRKLTNGKLPDTFKHVALEDRSPRRLLFSVTDSNTSSVPAESACQEFICHKAGGNAPCQATSTSLSSPNELNVCWKPTLWNQCPPTSSCTPTTPLPPLRLDQSDTCTQPARHAGGCNGCPNVARYDHIRDNPNVGETASAAVSLNTGYALVMAAALAIAVSCA